MASITLEPHGKAVLVKGETMGIKEALKAWGGRWNRGLSSWIFPGTKKAKLLEDLRGHSSIRNVLDNVGDNGSAAAPAKAAPAKRNAAEDSSEAPAAKKQKPSGGEDEQAFELGKEVQCTVRKFGGNMGADLRKYYTDKESGELKPTPKGIWLRAPEFQALRDNSAEIASKMRSSSSSGEATVKVTDDIIVTIRFEGSDAKSVDVRRFYVDKADGEQKPGKKGICLMKAQWDAFQDKTQDISAALGGAKVASASSSSAASSPSKTKKESKKSDPSNLDRIRLREKLQKILEGRDLNTLSLKAVRSELEASLNLTEGALLSRKEEVKGIVTDIIQGSGD
eukprot:TRINITY_DN16915_c0_g1_i1.p1 TRINITY_DN16915_c0_g1~~TRINITY_DN16915_c0_g1_i1.p1  ORF type:complete len:338 (+),score=93.22 TRINITY_DN16915_c0_g1_i1:137-1150(+)